MAKWTDKNHQIFLIGFWFKDPLQHIHVPSRVKNIKLKVHSMSSDPAKQGFLI